jgi:hypothetical protein
MPSKLSYVLASLLLSLSCGALAQVSTTVQLNSLTYRLIDLAPEDGITPWATLDLVDTSGTVAIFDDVIKTTVDECAIATTGSCSAAGPDGLGTAWFDGMRSGGHAEWSENASGVAHVSTRAQFRYNFSPATEMRLFLDGTVSKAPSGSNDSAGGLFYFTSYAFGDPTNYEGSRGIEEYRVGDRIHDIGISSRDEPVYGELLVYTDTWARHSLLPVPEPSTWGMLSAGLVLLAARWWRHRQWPRRR